MTENDAERCITIFKAAIKSKKTEMDYIYHLKRFRDWLKAESYSDMLLIPNLQQKLEDYVMHLRKTVHPNSVNTLYAPIQTFLEMNDVLLNFKKIRRLFPARVRTVVERGWTAEEIKRMLSVATNLRTKAIIHFENASGGRIGVFDGLKIKHLVPIEDCYAVTGYAGEREQYTTFLTPEARKALDLYIDKRRQDGEIITGESPVFRITYRVGSGRVKAATSQNLGDSVYAVQKKCGLRDPATKKGPRYVVPSNHGFRHRFDEIIKTTQGVNAHLAEKMFAHTSRIIPLDGTYLNPNTERLFQEYKKIIPALTIDDAEQPKISSTQIENQKTIDLLIEKLEEHAQEINVLKDVYKYARLYKIEHSEASENE